MENHHKSAFGRSVSMPIFNQQQEDDHNSRNNGVAVSDEDHHALQHSPDFQNYRNQAAGVWSMNGNGLVSPHSRTEGTKNGIHAAHENKTPSGTGSDFDMGATLSAMTDSSSASSSSVNSDATVRARSINDLTNRLSGSSIKEQNNANTAAIGLGSRSGAYAFTSASNGVSTMPELKSPFSRSFADDVGIVGQGHPLNKDSEYSQGSKTPQQKRLPGLEHRSPDTDKTSPPKNSGIYVPGGFEQHRRMTSRVSSLSGVRSRLGPQNLLDLSTDLSGLISPDSFLSNSPQQNGQYGTKPKKSPVKLDLHVLKVSANAVGSPYHRKSFGLGHARTITDPFVDTESMGNKSAMPPNLGAHGSEDVKLPSPSSVQVPATPDFQFPGSRGTQPMQNKNGTFSYHGFNSPSARRDFRIPNTPVFQPMPSSVPFDLPFTNGTASRVDLPIPPPPLSSVRGQLNHSVETRERLHAQAAIRADWIRIEAAKIAELSRQSFAAEQQFRATGLQEDFEQWQRLNAEFADATNLEKRQEERRNMFMPAGMQAMRTGADNVGGDQSASFGQGERQDEKEGKLLGFKMAHMERVCAEVKRRKDKEEAEEGEEITREMLATLNKEEKKVLRQYLADRLKAAAARRD